jgi:hypothetical protein
MGILSMFLLISTAGFPTSVSEDLDIIINPATLGSELEVRIERGLHSEGRIPVVIKSI